MSKVYAVTSEQTGGEYHLQQGVDGEVLFLRWRRHMSGDLIEALQHELKTHSVTVWPPVVGEMFYFGEYGRNGDKRGVNDFIVAALEIYDEKLPTLSPED